MALLTSCLHAARGAAVAVAALLAITAPGCSSDSSGAIRSGDAGTDGGLDSAEPANDSSAGSDISPPSMCQPADVSTFQPPTYAPASGEYQGICTQAQIGAVYADCLGSAATQASCDMLIGNGASSSDIACSNCIFSQDTDTTHGPIIDRGSTVAINVAGCVELLDPNALACAKSLQAADRCEVDACSANCPVSDAASLSLYDSCIETAAAGGCKTFEMATGCANVEADAGPASLCFAGMSFLQQYDIVVTLFCGPPPAAPDAGAETDAPSSD